LNCRSDSRLDPSGHAPCARRITMRFRPVPISSTSRSTKTRSPPAGLRRRRTITQPAKTSPGFLA